jgi:hypothetical protein
MPVQNITFCKSTNDIMAIHNNVSSHRMNMKILVFRDVTLCRLAERNQRFGGTESLNSNDGGSRFLQNIGIRPQDYMVPQPRRIHSPIAAVNTRSLHNDVDCSHVTWLDFPDGKIAARQNKFHDVRATSNDQVKDDEMARECSTNGGDKGCL